MTTEHLDAPESGRATELPPADPAEHAADSPARQATGGDTVSTVVFPSPRTGGDLTEPAGGHRPRGLRTFAALLAADSLAAGATFASLGVAAGSHHMLTVLAPGLLALLVLNARGGLYRPTALTGALDELPVLLGHIAAIWCVLATVLAATWPAHALGWGSLLGLAATHSALTCAARGGVHGVRRAAARRRPAPTLVVGGGPVARRLVDALHQHPEYGMRPVGVVHLTAEGPDEPEGDPGGPSLPLLAGDDVLRAVVQNSVRDAVFTEPHADEARAVELFRLLADQGCTAWLLDLPAATALPLGAGPLAGPARASAAGHLWGFRCHRVAPLSPHLAGRARKRALDLMVAVPTLVVAAPLLMACALAVRCADGPGVLFRQERVGQNGRPFVLLKFRTLRPADAHESATLWSIADDDRMSTVGRTLRRTSLDELPQLWNVVRGDMSLVGPRPERPHFVRKFSRSYPRYAARHRMPGGVTGLAQVHGLRGDTSIEDRARFDNHYIDSWSLWQDVRIMLRTAASLFPARWELTVAVTFSLPSAVRRPSGQVRAHLVRLGPVLPGVLTVLLLCAPVREEASAAGQATPADVMSGLFVLGCAVWLLRTRARPLDMPAACLLAAPAVACAAATAASYDPGASLPGFVRYAQIFVLVPAAVVLVLRDPHGFRVLSGAVLALALVQGAVGVHQYLTGTGASYAGQDIRAVGTFGPQDVMGMSAVVSCGLLVALGLGLAPPAGSPRWLRPAALGGAALLLVPLVVSFSRGAWIATVVASAAVLTLAGVRLALRTFGVLAAAAVLLVGGLGVGSQLIGERMSSISDVTAAPDQSVTDRYTMWAAATSIWRQDPATGAGPKGFAAHRDAHASLALSSGSDTAGAGQDFRKEPLLSPHNTYLLVLSEQGMLGLTAVVGGWAAIVVRTLRRLRAAQAAPPSPARATDCGLTAAGLLIWHLVDFGYSDIGGPSTVLTGIALGLAAWWALGRSAPECAAPPSAGAEAR